MPGCINLTNMARVAIPGDVLWEIRPIEVSLKTRLGLACGVMPRKRVIVSHLEHLLMKADRDQQLQRFLALLKGPAVQFPLLEDVGNSAIPPDLGATSV